MYREHPFPSGSTRLVPLLRPQNGGQWDCNGGIIICILQPPTTKQTHHKRKNVLARASTIPAVILGMLLPPLNLHTDKGHLADQASVYPSATVDFRDVRAKGDKAAV